MKFFTVTQAQGQLAELVAQAHAGEIIVLTSGENQVCLGAREPLDLQTDNEALEAQLVRAVNGPFTAYSPDIMRSIGDRILSERGT